MIIYRIKSDGKIQYVDTTTEQHERHVAQLIVDNYLYDSIDGEQYFVVNNSGRVIWNYRVETRKALEIASVDSQGLR